MAKISFENLYRKIISGFNENPPDSVWQNIQDDLDIDEVWSQIDSQLPLAQAKTNYSPVRQVVNYALFFLLLFVFKSNSDQQLLPFTSAIDNNQATLLIEENNKKENNPKKDRDENLLAGNKNIEDIAATSKKELEQKPSTTQKQEAEESKVTQNLDINNNHSNATVEKVITDATEEENFESTKNDDSPFTIHDYELNSLNPRSANFEFILTTNLPEVLLIDNIISNDSSEKAIPFIKLSSIGIAGNVKNSWIINNTTKASFNNEALINTEISYTNDFGVSSQFLIRTQQIIQLSYWFKATNSQDYFQYYNANYSRKEFNIAYQSLSVDFLQPLFSNENYLILGIQFAKIGSVQETLAGNFSDLSSNYSTWNYGIDLGLQKKFDLHSKLSFQPAIRLHYGLSNIFTGNEFIPREFDYTRPASISLDLKFFYHFIK